MDADREFLNFSDQLRLHTANLANLSLGDSIWSDSFVAGKRPPGLDHPATNDFAAAAWRTGFAAGQKLAFAENKVGRYSNNNNININNDHKNTGSIGFKSPSNFNSNGGSTTKSAFKSLNGKRGGNNGNSGGKGSGSKKNNNNEGSGNGAGVDKRFKTLPPAESLPRSEAIGGYIFVCNNDTMEENLRRQLFGLPQRYRDSVRAITPGLPIFLYNYSTHQLHGIFEAGSFGGTNIDPAAWEDKKKPGESRFPAQVRVVTRKNCVPLEEDSFRPILHHYDGPKFRLELSVPEALDVLDKFAENNA